MIGARAALLGGVTALGLTMLGVQAIGQSSTPESLLPPGFEEPSRTPAQPEPAPPPQAAPPSPTPTPSLTAEPQSEENADPSSEGENASLPSLDTRLAELEQLPAGSRRSLDAIGPLSERNGGLPAESYGRVNGRYASALLRNTRGKLVSRWGSLLLQRALLSETTTPSQVNGADWAAVRASLLLRIGAADSARRMVQEVDSPNFTPQLFDVAMQVYLATADPAGLCPILPFVPESKTGPQWQLMRAVCAALGGEQSSASEQIDRALGRSIADPIDILLAEKVVGASVNGRRAVTIEWDDVDRLTRWTFGMALTAGLEPPKRLFDEADWTLNAWRARAPMLPLASRVDAANVAAVRGLMSSSQMIDLYAAAHDDPGTPEELQQRTAMLRSAYVAGDGAGRIDAMRTFWDGAQDEEAVFAARILTADAAARIPAVADFEDDSSALIVSMLSAGFDQSAARWASVAPSGSLGRALILLSAPGRNRRAAETEVDAFLDDDDSDSHLKSKFLVAGLAGLGRLADADRATFEERLEFSLNGDSRWSKAIRLAATRRNHAMVAVLAAVGMQGSSWAQMTPRHLYHITASLRAVGLEAEARMIAAEAVSRA